jgi:glycine/D-amino acid oxidase-like deaminating enzyme
MPALRDSSLHSSSPLELLVVGQGLAGSLLAWDLIERGANFRILDGQLAHAAHRASAGMINPVSGPKRNRPWAWDSYFPLAARRYRELEKHFDLKAPLLHDLELLACFRDAADRERSLPRIAAREHGKFIAALHEPGLFAPAIADEFGSYELRGGLRFDVREFVALSTEEFRRRGLLIEDEFEPAELAVRSEGLIWKGWRAEQLVLATGYRAAATPWFADIPWRISRGETIDLALETEAPLPRNGVNRKEWLLGVAEDRARVGALFDWREPEAGPTAAGRQHLLEAAARLGAAGRRLVDHRAGTRAGGIDWRPYLGQAREDRRIHLLGGLGSKGALYGPGLAAAMTAHLLDGTPIPAELDLERRR